MPQCVFVPVWGFCFLYAIDIVQKWSDENPFSSPLGDFVFYILKIFTEFET